MNTVSDCPFTLCLEAWPQADLRLPAQHPLGLARQNIALRLAHSARDMGASLLLLADSANSLVRLRAASDFALDAFTTAYPHDWQKHVAAESLVLLVRWGSGALLTSKSLLRLASTASRGQTWANRISDADIMAGFAPLDLRGHVSPQTVFPPTAATLFRLLTGSDLSLFAACTGNSLSQNLAQLPVPAVRHNIAAVTYLMTQRSAELVIIGDPGAEGWKHLERETACRVRLLADGPDGLLASLLQSAGPRRFARYLRDLGDAALINTRTLFAASDCPSSDDFFWSDLGHAERVAHPVLRALTEILLASDQAILPGGASLTSGGIYLLVEKAWAERDLPRQVSVLKALAAGTGTKE